MERSLRAALGEAEWLARLADDLLVLARERAGLLVVRDNPVDLFDLAAPRLAAWRPRSACRSRLFLV